MSTDVPTNVPGSGRPTEGEPTSATEVAPEETAAVEATPDATSAVETPAVEAPDASDSSTAVESPADLEPAPRVDETHVALPAQHERGFDEVDGGDDADAVPTTTFVPTAEEDAALRDERARRFGRPRAESAEAAPEPVEEPTVAVAPLAAGGAAGLAASRVASPTETQTMPATTAPEGDDDPFSEFDDGPTSRAAAHWWSILISIVFVPVAWYLLTDGGERTSFNLVGGGPFNLAGPLELAGGALALFFVLLAARWSSVGVILTGTVSALLGIAFLAVNDEAMRLVGEYQGTLVQALNQLGQNIVDHLLADAQSGRLAVYGIVLIMVGVVSHGARRQGRREEKRRAALGV